MANKSQLAEQALRSIGGLYGVERQVRDMSDEDCSRVRQEKAAPIIATLYDWVLAQRDLMPNGSATAKALDYSLHYAEAFRLVNYSAGGLQHLEPQKKARQGQVSLDEFTAARSYRKPTSSVVHFHNYSTFDLALHKVIERHR